MILLTSAPVSRAVGCHHKFPGITGLYNRITTKLQFFKEHDPSSNCRLCPN